MKNIYHKFIMPSIIGTALLFTTPVLASDWEFVNDKEQVKVFKKEIKGTPFVAFKGIKTMQLPITKVAQVLLDRDKENRKKWIDMIVDFEFLDQTDNYAIFYSSYDLPWPISDRDYVMKSELKIDNVKNRVVIELKSTEHPKAPKTIGVRAEIVKSRYILNPLPNGHTEVIVEIQTDPKGLLPSWLVNMIQKDWPVNTLTKMEAQAALASTPHNELVKQRLNILKSYSMR